MHVDRLKHLLQTLHEVALKDETQPDHCHFTMSNWANQIEVDCGTVGCALGWEATTPYANERGLHLIKILNEETIVPIIGVNSMGFAAGSVYFDIPYDTSTALFDPSSYDIPGNYDRIKPIQVIQRIEYLLDVGELNFDDEVEHHRLPGGASFINS